MKRTTVFIDENLLEEAIKLTGAKTRRQVITAGLRDQVRVHHRKAFARELGTFELDLTLEKLKDLRMPTDLFLVDTSVWIMVLRKDFQPDTKNRIEYLLAENRVAICDIIRL